MLVAATLVQSLAVAGGLVLARRHVTARAVPAWLALAHWAAGGLALLGLALSATIGELRGLGMAALPLLLLAGLEGGVLFGFRLRDRRLPAWLIAAHGLTAIAACALLLSFLMGARAA